MQDTWVISAASYDMTTGNFRARAAQESQDAVGRNLEAVMRVPVGAGLNGNVGGTLRAR